MRALTLLILTCVFLATACGDDDSEIRGELGDVTFEYECVDSSDYQCLNESRGLPDAIGVGGRFRLNEDEWFSTRQDIHSASSQMVEKTGSVFVWKRAGYAAILIFEWEDDDIEDFIHLKGADVEVLNIINEDYMSKERANLRVGEYLELYVRPETRFGTVLGGAFNYQWSSDDERVVEVTLRNSNGEDLTNQVTLSGRGVGSAEVTVTLRGVSASVQVEVTANPDLEEDASISIDDASMDDAAMDDATMDDADVYDSETVDYTDASEVDDAGSDEEQL